MIILFTILTSVAAAVAAAYLTAKMVARATALASVIPTVRIPIPADPGVRSPRLEYALTGGVCEDVAEHQEVRVPSIDVAKGTRGTVIKWFWVDLHGGSTRFGLLAEGTIEVLSADNSCVIARYQNPIGARVGGTTAPNDSIVRISSKDFFESIAIKFRTDFTVEDQEFLHQIGARM